MKFKDLDSLPPTVSVQQAADILGIGRGLAYDLVKRRALRALRLGGRILIPTSSLIELLGGSSVDGAAVEKAERSDETTLR